MTASPLEVFGMCVGPLQENTYVLGSRDTGEALVVDPGAEPERIQAEAQRRRWQITWIAITHGHADHISAVGALRRSSGARVATPAGDNPMLQDAILSGAAWLGFHFEPITPDLELRGSSPWHALDREWTILETPGHTPGHICLHSPADRLLLCGDVLFSGSVGRTDLPGASWPQLAHSLREKVFQLPDDTRVLPGHGPETTLGEERLGNPFVQLALANAPDPMASFDVGDS